MKTKVFNSFNSGVQYSCVIFLLIRISDYQMVSAFGKDKVLQDANCEHAELIRLNTAILIISIVSKL